MSSIMPSCNWKGIEPDDLLDYFKLNDSVIQLDTLASRSKVTQKNMLIHLEVFVTDKFPATVGQALH